MKLKRREFILASIAGLIGVLLGDALLYEPRIAVAVSRVELRFEALEDKVRIAQLSDVHFGNPSPVWSAVEVVQGVKPDLIAVTGDIFTDGDELENGVKLLEELSETADVFLVHGNWDYWSGADLDRLEREAGRLGVRVLRNSGLQFRGDIWIAGVDDPYTRRDRLNRALMGSSGVKILLAHSPQIIGEAEGKVELVISGHTHGGQVAIPGLGPLYVPLPKKYRRYVAGLYEVNGTYLYVNRGIGNSFLPVRFACPPEVTVFELGPREG